MVAISPLLRELILAACDEPVMWDEDGPVAHVVALALHEIGRAADPADLGPGLSAIARLRASRGAAGGSRRLRADLGFAETAGVRAHPGAVVPARDRHEFPGVATAVAADRGAGAAGAGRHAGARRSFVGYASGPAFGAAFRTAFGTTPGRTRRARHPRT